MTREGRENARGPADIRVSPSHSRDEGVPRRERSAAVESGICFWKPEPTFHNEVSAETERIHPYFPSTFPYASAFNNPSRSAGLVSFIWIIHPSP